MKRVINNDYHSSYGDINFLFSTEFMALLISTVVDIRESSLSIFVHEFTAKIISTCVGIVRTIIVKKIDTFDFLYVRGESKASHGGSPECFGILR